MSCEVKSSKARQGNARQGKKRTARQGTRKGRWSCLCLCDFIHGTFSFATSLVVQHLPSWLDRFKALKTHRLLWHWSLHGAWMRQEDMKALSLFILRQKQFLFPNECSAKPIFRILSIQIRCKMWYSTFLLTIQTQVSYDILCIWLAILGIHCPSLNFAPKFFPSGICGISLQHDYITTKRVYFVILI